jgi:hypothetical protein
MTSESLSHVAIDVVEAMRKTARNMIGGAGVGVHRVIHAVDARFETTVQNRTGLLSPKLREDLVVAQREVTGYYAAGLRSLVGSVSSIVNTGFDVASNQIKRLSSNAEKFETEFVPRTMNSFTRLTMPAAQITRETSKKLADTSGYVAGRIQGEAETLPVAVPRTAARKKGRRAA